MTSGYILDLKTLFVVTIFIATVGGLMLLMSWLQNRRMYALALWGVGFMLCAFAAGLVSVRNLISDSWSIVSAMGVLCLAYGVMWAGARTFEGRSVRLSWIIAGALIWIVGSQVPSVFESMETRAALSSIILATYTMLSARELWHARDKELISRWPTFALLLLHAGFVLGRIPLADSLPFPYGPGLGQGIAARIMGFEGLFVAFCLTFLRVNMAKERAELEQRRAALADPLTGVANRRAFFDLGTPLLERTIIERRPAAMLLFDLDRFKQINDTAGHQAGDDVLKAFTDLVATSMRPGDLFGRVGGEEFACFMTDTSMTQALTTAERMRRDFEAMGVGQLPVGTTVSVGVAAASDTGGSLHDLLAAADRALYRAKAKGRNRVEPARMPLALVEPLGAAAI